MFDLFIFLIFIIQTTTFPNSIGVNKINTRKLEELSDDIVILHVNDVHCGVNDTIGYDGFALYRDDMKKKYKNVLTVDVGDHVQGGTLGAITDGSAIIDIINQVGFDVATLGNHEFDYGISQLTLLADNIKSKYICANYCYNNNKSTIFEPYKIIEAGNKKIAFIGVVTPLTFSKTYLSSLKDENGDPLYDFLSGNDGQQLYDKVQEYINEVKDNEKVDYVILLTHIGMHVEQYKSELLLSKLDRVDAVLDGHTHKVYNTTSEDKNQKNITITQTGTKLETIGKLILKKDGTITSEIIKEVPEPSDKTNAIQINRGGEKRWVNKEMNEYITKKWDENKDILSEKLGHSNFDLIIKPENNTGPHPILCRYQECNLGNLVSDALKHAGNAEISILNGGAVRDNLYKGDISRGNILAVLPWYNNIVQKQITGQAILDALEFGVSKLPNANGGFPQVSGITYDIDVGTNSTVLTDSSGMFLNVTGKRRVSNVKINGEEIDVNRKYNASMLEFIANGGDGYSMFTPFEIYNESLMTDTDGLPTYIEEKLNGEIPEKYEKLQGRINIYNSSEPILDTTDYDTTIAKFRNNFFERKKSGGLNAGAIIGLILGLVGALIAVAVLAFVLKSNSPQVQVPRPEMGSNNELNINKV